MEPEQRSYATLHQLAPLFVSLERSGVEELVFIYEMSISIEWTENQAASLLWGSNEENEKRGGGVDEG